MTCGPAGVLLDHGERQETVPAFPAPTITDQTGAGDVFAGTMAGRLALGDDLGEAVRLAAAAASLSLAGQGGTGYIPELTQTRALLNAQAAGS